MKLDPDPHWVKQLDQDPQKINAYPLSTALSGPHINELTLTQLLSPSINLAHASVRVSVSQINYTIRNILCYTYSWSGFRTSMSPGDMNSPMFSPIARDRRIDRNTCFEVRGTSCMNSPMFSPIARDRRIDRNTCFEVRGPFFAISVYSTVVDGHEMGFN